MVDFERARWSRGRNPHPIIPRGQLGMERILEELLVIAKCWELVLERGGLLL
jgi:hypothetical protein